MTRALYRCLLRLHPPAFRQEFASDMLWIFEEAAANGVAPLFADGVISLLRQWILRSDSWKVAAALVGGALQVMAGGLGALMVMHANNSAHRGFAQLRPAIAPAETLAIENMMHVAMWAVAAVLAMVAVLVLWVRSMNAQRLVRLSAAPGRR
jgi:hypothetical protein